MSVTDASPEIEDYVREIQKKMKMEHMTIRLRRMSRNFTLLMGRENAGAMSIPFANTILISEEWFNSLPEKEQRALIGHELAHIRKKHAYKKLALIAICSPLLILVVLASRFYSRMCESEADYIAATELDNIDGCINLFKRLKNLKDPKSRFLVKRMVRKVFKIVTYPARKLCATHPSLSKRIKNLEKLAAEKDTSY